MADYIIKGETLTNIANAIRAKSGGSATMTPEQMSTEIENIRDIDALIDGSITEITSNVTTINSYAFYNCTALTSVNFPNAVSVGDYTFRGCSRLTSVHFPNVTTIGGYAFRNCSKLTNLTIPNSVTDMGHGVFNGCRSLNSVTIGNSVTTINNSMFNGCFLLKKIIIGVNRTGVTTLSNTNAFTDCFYILGTVHSTYNPNGDKDGFIYVPNNLVADYRTATNWSEYASQIMPWVATVEELANIDSTTYDYACVGEGLDSVEYHYNGTTWEVFR